MPTYCTVRYYDNGVERDVEVTGQILVQLSQRALVNSVEYGKQWISNNRILSTWTSAQPPRSA